MAPSANNRPLRGRGTSTISLSIGTANRVRRLAHEEGATLDATVDRMLTAYARMGGLGTRNAAPRAAEELSREDLTESVRALDELIDGLDDAQPDARSAAFGFARALLAMRRAR